MQSLVRNINDLFVNVLEKAQSYNNCSIENFTLPDEENKSYVSDVSLITEDNLNLLLHLFPNSSKLHSKFDQIT